MSIIIFDIQQNTLIFAEQHGLLDKLYYLKVRVPTIEDVKTYLVKSKKTPTNKISEFFKNGIEEGIYRIKSALSKLDDKVPLFDIYTMNIYLVDRTQIYEKVMKEYNRFPNQQVINNLKQKKDKLNEQYERINKDIVVFEKKMKSNGNILNVSKEEYQEFQNKKLNIERTHHKLKIGLEFMESFILKKLESTYIRTLYTYTTELGKNITLCERPSFTYRSKYLSPYYTRDEVIKLALNMELIKHTDDLSDSQLIDSLCKKVMENDINAKILVKHQEHIIKNKMLGLVQYYSLQGSYFMNQYLRGYSQYNYVNTYLESLIIPIWKLIHTAPKFDKDYILYRFVQTDSHISHLKIGDIYTEKGFTSTTRDPFYQSDEYKFGWILIKIKLPSKQNGIALSIETVSHFPREQEIILSPNTQFKLINKDDKSIYHHIDQEIGKKIKGTYEFEIIGKLPIDIEIKPIIENNEQHKEIMIDSPRDRTRVNSQHYMNTLSRTSSFSESSTSSIDSSVRFRDTFHKTVVPLKTYFPNGEYASPNIKRHNAIESIQNISVGNIMPIRKPYVSNDEPINFLEIDKFDVLTIEEKIHRFVNHYVNPLHQFNIVIGNKKLTVMSEWYDGSGVYKNFYASSSKNGYSIYTIYKNHLLFIIEIGQHYDVPFMFVNYHVKFTTLDRDNEIGSENFLKFIASVAYYFEIESVILYADYVSCDYVMTDDVRASGEDMGLLKMFGGTYCTDFYDYLKFGKKKYHELGIIGSELIPKFKYHMLDIIKQIQPDSILHKFDVEKTYDKIYQIYEKTYRPFVPEINNTLANFYIWLAENHCFLLDDLIRKFNNIPQYITENPFQTDYYIFNASQYLYNKGLINYIPHMQQAITNDTTVKTKGVRINRYRITDDQRVR